MAFSATEAAFEGFRVVRRKPLALVFWSLFYVLLFGLAVAIVGRQIVNLAALSKDLEGSTSPSFEDMTPILDAYNSMAVLLAPLFIVAGAVLAAAIARSVLRPSQSAFGYLRLGMDEIRVLIVTLVLSIVITLALVVPMAFVAYMIALAVSGVGVAVLGAMVGVLATIALAAWLGVRLSLAVPITVAQGKMAFFDSWRVTKGRFWPLLGMAFIALLMSFVVSMLGSIVVTPIQLAVGGFSRLADFTGEDLRVTLQALWPIILTGIITQSILSALQLAVLYAPFSAAYRDIVGDRPEQAFD